MQTEGQKSLPKLLLRRTIGFFSLSNQVKDILVEKDRHGGSLLDMNRSGNKDVLDHDLSAIRRDLTENEVRCHPRTEHTTQQTTTTTGGFTQDMVPVS